MTRALRPIALLAAWLALGGVVSAQDGLNKRVSLDLKAMAPRDAFNVIATAIRYTADVAPEVTAAVDILVNHVRARVALDTICDSIGCEWEANGTVIRIRTQGGEPPGSTVVTARIQRGQSRGSLQVDARIEPRTPESVKKVEASVNELKRRMNPVLPADMTFENAPLSEVAERLTRATGFEVSFRDESNPGTSAEIEALERQLAQLREKLNPVHPDVRVTERMLRDARAAAGSRNATGRITADLGGHPFQAALTVISEQLPDHVTCRVVVPSTDNVPAVVLLISRPRR